MTIDNTGRDTDCHNNQSGNATIQPATRRKSMKGQHHSVVSSCRKKRTYTEVEDVVMQDNLTVRDIAVPSSKKRSKVVPDDGGQVKKKGFGTSFGAVKKRPAQSTAALTQLNSPKREPSGLRELASSPLFGMKKSLELDLPCIASDKKPKPVDKKRDLQLANARKLLDFDYKPAEDEGFVSKATSLANSVSPNENQLLTWGTSGVLCPKPVAAPVSKQVQDIDSASKFNFQQSAQPVHQTFDSQESSFVAYGSSYRTVTPNGSVQLSTDDNADALQLQMTDNPDDLFKYSDPVPDTDEPETSTTKKVVVMKVSKYIPKDCRDVIMSPSGIMRHRPRAAKSPWPADLPKMSQVLSEEFAFRDELFQQWHKVEETYLADPNYFNRQKLNDQQREIIVLEMMHAAMTLKLHRQTLQLAVNYFDRFMSLTIHLNPMLYLALACCALSLAIKSEEEKQTIDLMQLMSRFPEIVFSKSQVCAIELQMFQVLDWRLSPPTVFDWTCLYMRKATLCYPALFPPPEHQQVTSSADDKYANMPFQFRTDLFKEIMQLVDLFLLTEACLYHTPSTIAATAFYIVCSNHHEEFKQLDNRFRFRTMFETCTNFEADEIKLCCDGFNEFVTSKTPPKFIYSRHLVNCSFREMYQEFPQKELQE